MWNIMRKLTREHKRKISESCKKRVFEKQPCKKCGKIFLQHSPNQLYCGSKTNKIGCSWNNIKEKKKEYFMKHLRDWYRKYDRENKKKERKLNTDYSKRQKESRKKWRNSKAGKEWIRKNYKKYLPIKLLCNKRRQLRKMGVIGSHTLKEWEDIKRKHEYCCAECGVSEKRLAEKWRGTNFNKLTKDHVVPISKGGNNKIENIQPLCISCNAKKKDKIKKLKRGITFGSFDILHIGHIRMLKDAKKKCDYLIVGVQKDPSIDREDKHQPIQEHRLRMEAVSAIKYVDEVVPYNTEKDLLRILKRGIEQDRIHIRIIGEDWRVKDYTGKGLDIPVYFNKRKHHYSSTYMRKLVKKNHKKL